LFNLEWSENREGYNTTKTVSEYFEKDAQRKVNVKFVEGGKYKYEELIMKDSILYGVYLDRGKNIETELSLQNIRNIKTFSTEKTVLLSIGILGSMVLSIAAATPPCPAPTHTGLQNWSWDGLIQ